MGYTREPHTTGNLERTPEGDGVVVFPPCCEGARVFVPLDEALPPANSQLVCPIRGHAWLVELVADETAECGLRPVWADPETVAAAARVTRLSDTVRLTTPCHGARVDFPADEALPDIQLLATCATEGRRWHVELVVDHEAEAGLHAVWTDPACPRPDIDHFDGSAESDGEPTRRRGGAASRVAPVIAFP